MVRLTDTQLVILSAASQREDRGVELLANVQGKAAGKVVAKLVRAGLLEEMKASGSLPVWRRDDESGASGASHHKRWPRSDRCRGQSDRRAGGERHAALMLSAGEAITSRKRISVSAQTSARRRHRSGKAKTRDWLASRQPAGLKASSGAGDAGPIRRSDDCCHHASDPLAAAFGARLFRRCSAQETRPRSSLGEGRR